MDPNAALALLLDALTDGDTATAEEHFHTLTNWIDHGGYPPADPRNL